MQVWKVWVFLEVVEVLVELMSQMRNCLMMEGVVVDPRILAAVVDDGDVNGDDVVLVYLLHRLQGLIL